MRKNKGITLIALIITIIILIILAVVAVGIVKEANLLEKAQLAIGLYNDADMLEKINLAVSETLMQTTISTELDFVTILEENLKKYLKTEDVTVEILYEELEESYLVKIDNGKLYYKVLKNGHIYKYTDISSAISKYKNKWILRQMDDGSNILSFFSNDTEVLTLEKECTAVVLSPGNQVINKNKKIDIESENIKISLYPTSKELEKVDVNNLKVCFFDEAFTDCKKLKEVVNWTKTLNTKMPHFENCYNLTSLTIPYGINIIGQHVFSNCNNIKTIYIPNSVEHIQEQAFTRTPLLETIIIDKKFASILGSPWNAPSTTVISWLRD